MSDVAFLEVLQVEVMSDVAFLEVEPAGPSAVEG